MHKLNIVLRRRQGQSLNGYVSVNNEKVLNKLVFDENTDLRKLPYEEIMVNDCVLTEKTIFSILKLFYQIYVILNFPFKNEVLKLKDAFFFANLKQYCRLVLFY